MTTDLRWRAAVGAALACLALPALAGRPFATEDAGVLEAATCELEAFGSRATARETPSETGWWVQPGCGVGLRTQVGAGAGRSRSAGESTWAAAVVGKTFLRELKDDQAGVTLAYQFSWQKAPGESLKYDVTDVKGVVSVPLGALLLHANLGWNRGHRISTTTWAVAFEYATAAGFDFGVEAYGDDRSAAFVGLGARYAVLAEKFFVDMSYAEQTDSARARSLTVGLKLAFN